MSPLNFTANSVKFCLKCEIGMSDCGVGINFKPFSSKEIRSVVER